MHFGVLMVLDFLQGKREWVTALIQNVPNDCGHGTHLPSKNISRKNVCYTLIKHVPFSCISISRM